jgi:acetyl-CoA carboxylase carboxyltransferase component
MTAWVAPATKAPARPPTEPRRAAVHEVADRLSAPERLELLFDPGSLELIRTGVTSRRLGAKAQPGDGVVAGAGTIDGRPVLSYAQDARFKGGSLGEAHADTIVRVLRLAGDSGRPVVGFVESGGARLQEGTAALAGYGRIFRENVALSGRVPQISIIAGASAGGGSYSPALTDFVVMTENATMFLTGPGVVAEAIGERVTAQDLGGPQVHEHNGVSHFTAESDAAAIFLVRELLAYLPQSAAAPLPRPMPEEPPMRDPGALVPVEGRKVYDVRDVIQALADGGRMLEVSRRYGRNIVTAFARLDGRPVGVIANQPRYLGGTIDCDAAQKAARFVRTCNAYGLPLVVLVDTPGFMPGTRQEQGGVIRHGAKLLHAFAEATVPKVSIVLRKAFGGAYITMNSKDLGADLAFAWPNAEIGVMAALPAVGVIRKREIAEATEPAARRDELASEYAEEHLSAGHAAAEGFVDEVIEPIETRARLCWSLSLLERTREVAPRGGNIPL